MGWWAKAGVVGNSLELSTAAAVRASASSTSPQRGSGLVVGLEGAPIALSPGACELEPQHCARALCRLYSARTVVGTNEFAFDRRAMTACRIKASVEVAFSDRSPARGYANGGSDSDQS